ncbi:MAG: phosphoglycolate phosphatase [Methanomicrobiales archaeon]|nr:phosphoglycolate phosphatase [Methanomicrobiales archaeon]
MLRALVCDIDGTITDRQRRVNTAAIEEIRSLVEKDIAVVLASGNTACFMDAACRLVGTNGAFIGENGGVYRREYGSELCIERERRAAEEAYRRVEAHFRERGIALELYSDRYRFTDIAFARTVSSDEVKGVLGEVPIKVVDTGFAIHLQAPGLNKGEALKKLSVEMGLSPKDFVAVGDSINDLEMIEQAGLGIAVANGHPKTKAAAFFVTEKSYGEGFVEAMERCRDLFLR